MLSPFHLFPRIPCPGPLFSPFTIPLIPSPTHPIHAFLVAGPNPPSPLPQLHPSFVTISTSSRATSCRAIAPQIVGFFSLNFLTTNSTSFGLGWPYRKQAVGHAFFECPSKIPESDPPPQAGVGASFVPPLPPLVYATSMEKNASPFFPWSNKEISSPLSRSISRGGGSSAGGRTRSFRCSPFISAFCDVC